MNCNMLIGALEGVNDHAQESGVSGRILAEFFKEDGIYVGIYRALNVSNFGETLDGARKALAEAVEAFLEECDRIGTLDAVMEEAGLKQTPGLCQLHISGLIC